MTSKLQLVFLAITIILLSGCFNGSKTRLLGEKVVQNNLNNQVVVNEVNFLDVLNYGDVSDIESLDIYKLIKSRKALFILTNSDDKIATTYGNTICGSMNNRLTNEKYVCLAQPISNFYQNLANYANKNQQSETNKQLFSADFLITRLDYLIDKQENNSGPLESAPYLDMVMFLNGNYLYLWGDEKYSATELTKQLESFQKTDKKQHVFKIAVANDFAKELVVKILEANNLTENVELDRIDISNSKIDKKKYQVIAYAGSNISSAMSNYILKNYPNYVPLGLVDYVIENTISKNKELSSYNVANYYTTEGLLKNINIKNSQTKIVQSDKNNKVDINNKVKEKTNSNQSSGPAYTSIQSYDQNDFSNSKFDFKVGTIPEILKVDTIVNPSNAVIKTIGIPNVLVATRTADSVEIYNLFYSFIENHDFLKSNYITKDMRNFSVSDLIVSNLKINNLIYSYGVTNFLKYYQSNTNKETVSEAVSDASRTIKEELKTVNSPPFYGPKIPNKEQFDVINYQNSKRINVNKEIQSLRALQEIIDNIKNDIAGNKDGSSGS